MHTIRSKGKTQVACSTETSPPTCHLFDLCGLLNPEPWPASCSGYLILKKTGSKILLNIWVTFSTPVSKIRPQFCICDYLCLEIRKWNSHLLEGQLASHSARQVWLRVVQTALHVQQRLGSLGRQLHKPCDPEQDRDQSVTSRNAGTSRAVSFRGLARSEGVNLKQDWPVWDGGPSWRGFPGPTRMLPSSLSKSFLHISELK